MSTYPATSRFRWLLDRPVKPGDEQDKGQRKDAGQLNPCRSDRIDRLVFAVHEVSLPPFLRLLHRGAATRRRREPAASLCLTPGGSTPFSRLSVASCSMRRAMTMARSDGRSFSTSWSWIGPMLSCREASCAAIPEDAAEAALLRWATPVDEIVVVLVGLGSEGAPERPCLLRTRSERPCPPRGDDVLRQTAADRGGN